MIIYLSGCYSGNIEENIEIARKVAIKLWEKGYTVLTPHLNTYHFEKDCKCSYDDFIRGDLEMISRCDAICMLQGWMCSQGACREKEFAKYLGIPIFYYPDIPIRRKEMTEPQEYHLMKIISKFIQRVIPKYSVGQFQHLGNLFNKPNLPMLMEEVIDMAVYSFTLEDQVKQACSRIDSDEPIDAKNILTIGNADGKREEGD